MSNRDGTPDSNAPGNEHDDAGSEPRAGLPLGSTVVSLRLSNPEAAEAREVPVTFAQVFRRAEVPEGATLVGRIASRDVTLQVTRRRRTAMAP